MLTDVVVIGLAGFALATAVRVAVEDFLPKMLLKKPVSCDACLSFWCSLVCGLALVGVSYFFRIEFVTITFAATGVSLLALKIKARLERED